MLQISDLKGALIAIAVACVAYLIYYFATDGGNDAD